MDCFWTLMCPEMKTFNKIFDRYSMSSKNKDNLEKCRQWISIPTVNPYTGKNITVGENTYNQLQRICAQLGIQLCNNQTTPFMLENIKDIPYDNFIFYNDPNNGLTYCFEPEDIDGLLQNPKNPWTRAPLSEEFIQKLNLLKQNIQVPEIFPDQPMVLSINDMRTEVDRVLNRGYDDGSGPDPYVNVDQFLRILLQNIDILIPDTIDRNDPDAVIRFLYNNRFNKVSNKSFIYMIVKYALNKRSISLENIPPDEAQFMRSTNEAILSLIGSYPGIGASREIEEGDLVDRRMREERRSREEILEIRRRGVERRMREQLEATLRERRERMREEGEATLGERRERRERMMREQRSLTIPTPPTSPDWDSLG